VAQILASQANMLAVLLWSGIAILELQALWLAKTRLSETC